MLIPFCNPYIVYYTMNFTMTTKKMMVIGISFVLAAMLLSSGNTLNTSFAQPNTVGQTDTVGQPNTVGQTSDGGESNNSDRQNYDDFQNCLENEAGTSGFATEQQIRDCFAPIYIGGSADDDSGSSSSDDDSGSSSSDDDSGSSSSDDDSGSSSSDDDDDSGSSN
jgi:hypothetical protein